MKYGAPYFAITHQPKKRLLNIVCGNDTHLILYVGLKESVALVNELKKQKKKNVFSLRLKKKKQFAF